LNLADYQIKEFRTEHQKYGVKILHVPTGMTIEGNCGWVDKVEEIKQQMLVLLEESVQGVAPLPPPEVIEPRSAIVEQCARIVDRYVSKEASDENSRLRAIAQAIRAIK
jgi:hypothetical protein